MQYLISFQNGKEIPIERADRTITSKVTFEISFGQEAMGNITFGLFGRTCPKTVRNFVTLANPNRPVGEGYKGSKFHRIVKGFAFQGILKHSRRRFRIIVICEALYFCFI